VPAGTFLGKALGWWVAFLVMTLLAVAVIGWIVALVPEYPGQRAGARTPMLRTLGIPGVAPVLFVTLVLVLAHTILYTYVGPLLARRGLGGATDLVLLVFGAASLLSIWVVGARIDRRLRVLTIAATVLIAVAAAILLVPAGSSAPVYLAAALWGLGWGGAPTLLQTAAGRAAGEAADAAQAMLVTLWNAAMAGGGVVGGILLGLFGAGSFPWSVLGLLVPVLAVVLAARAHGFPARRSS
jgi:predicted MFS family arabinose efflux permease